MCEKPGQSETREQHANDRAEEQRSPPSSVDEKDGASGHEDLYGHDQKPA